MEGKKARAAVYRNTIALFEQIHQKYFRFRLFCKSVFYDRASCSQSELPSVLFYSFYWRKNKLLSSTSSAKIIQFVILLLLLLLSAKKSSRQKLEMQYVKLFLGNGRDSLGQIKGSFKQMLNGEWREILKGSLFICAFVKKSFMIFFDFF